MSRSRRPHLSEPRSATPVGSSRTRRARALARRPACVGVALALGALGLAGCATSTHPGLAVDQLQSNVNFGLPPTPTAAPATQAAAVSSGGFSPQIPGAPVALPPAAQLPAFQYTAPPSFNFPSISTGSGATGLAAACPAPAPGSSPALAASETSPHPPAAGYYLWQLLIPVSVPQPGGKTSVVVTRQLTDYRVTNPSKVTTTSLPAGQGTSTSFTYDEVEPLADGGSLTYGFEVVNNAPGQQQVDAEGETATTIVGVNDGVSITSEVERNAKGQVTGTFVPSTPVTILPLPVVPGAKFQSTGTDPTTGQSLTVDGQIQTTDRVPGCGIYAAGWKVVATEGVSRGAGAPGEATDTYSVAPQYGGLVVEDSTASELASAAYATQVGLVTPSRTPVSSVGGAG